MQSMTAGFCRKVLALFVLGVLVLTFAPGDAQADATWKNIRGASVCGGLDSRGNLQPSCAHEPAKFIGAAVKNCPKGTFAAAGDCYACPTGFDRNIARKVTHERACRKPAPAQTMRAVKVDGGKCPSGSTFDPRNGGECWTCPSGFGRTAAAVNAWNACGKIGKKAVSATFVGRRCPVEGSVFDGRNGGECWSCPEDSDRTVNTVTGPNACKTSFQFAAATKKSELKCAPGQIHDLIDGGTCWTCPDGAKRTLASVKSAQACRDNKMKWELPKRQLYGLFGLGSGAEDILAKMIAERTEIDNAVKALATNAGEPDAKRLLEKTWDAIDNRPWESPVLVSLLAQRIMEAATKAPGARTASEADAIARISQLIQWNRQFIAYQAKQAHETWVLASKKQFEVSLAKMGAAAIYADSMVTPPNYNETLVASIQGGAMLVGPVGASLVPVISQSVRAVTFPFRKITEKVVIKAAENIVKQTIKSGMEVASGMSTGSVAAATAAGPAIVLLAASVIVTMEIDKFLALEKAEGQIRQAIDISNRSVNLNTLLQQEGGPEEFLFHWASVLGAQTRPSANFVKRLAAYKAGETPSAAAGPSLPKGGSGPTADMVQGTGTTQLNGSPMSVIMQSTQQAATPGTAPKKETRGPIRPSLNQVVEAAVRAQTDTPPAGGIRIEMSRLAGKCMSTGGGGQLEVTLDDCRKTQALWIVPNGKNNTLVFAGEYCLRSTGGVAALSLSKLVIAKCAEREDRNEKWELTREGLIKQVGTKKCLSYLPGPAGTGVSLGNCNAKNARQIWRPWARG